jgi:hypothetical protein
MTRVRAFYFLQIPSALVSILLTEVLAKHSCDIRSRYWAKAYTPSTGMVYYTTKSYVRIFFDAAAVQ